MACFLPSNLTSKKFSEICDSEMEFEVSFQRITEFYSRDAAVEGVKDSEELRVCFSSWSKSPSISIVWFYWF